MGPGMFDDSLKEGVIALICIGVAIGFGIFVALPWLWTILKPLIHTWTA